VSALLVRLGAGEGLLEISPAIDAPAVEVQVLGRPPLQLGPLAAGQTARLAISSPSGLPLHAGVSLLLGAGRRLHAVARATDDPSTTRAGKQADEHLLQALRRAGLPALRPSRAGLHSVLDLQGRLLVQWQQPLSWGRLDRLR